VGRVGLEPTTYGLKVAYMVSQACRRVAACHVMSVGTSRRRPGVSSVATSLRHRGPTPAPRARLDNGPMVVEESSAAVLVAVPSDAVDELEKDGLAFSVPSIRGPVLDAVIAIGVDAAALVTLLQTPSTIRAFAEWVTRRTKRTGDSIEINARRGTTRVFLKVDGQVSTDVVADFLLGALGPPEVATETPSI
jgi:hypothetical protein